MKEAHAIIGPLKFDCSVIPGRYTCNPLSELCEAEDIKDERVPVNCIIFCGPDNSVQILPWRYESKRTPGKVIQSRICIHEDEDDDRYWITLDKDGMDGFWRSDWRLVECYSSGHVEFIFDLLLNGNIQDVETSAKVKFLQAGVVSELTVSS